MLSNLMKVHHAKQTARKERQEKKKREAIISATALTHALVDHLNAGVANAYVNQKKLDTETKILQANATQFSKQTAHCELNTVYVGSRISIEVKVFCLPHDT
ncbi:BL1S1-like protein, partial [Mya arenaria]